MDKPVLTDKCDSCSHPFSKHYGSYDGTANGCTITAPSRSYEDCRCQGFARVYRYPVPSAHHDVAAYYNK